MERYIDAATVAAVTEQLVRPERPTAHQTFTTAQKAAGIAALAVCAVLAYHNLLGLGSFVITIFTGVFLLILIAKTLVTGASLDGGIVLISDEEIANLNEDELPVYGILVPLRGEEEVVHHLVDSLSKLDYPVEKMLVILLLEENDPRTVSAVGRLQLPTHFHVLVLADEGARTKPKACNIGAWYARELGVERVVIYDAEDRVDPLQLKKAIIAQAKTGAAVIQGKLEYHNPEQNVLTRLFAAEYATFYNLFLPGLGRLNWLVPLGGTSNHFILKDLWQIGCWDSTNVTEDMDLGVYLSKGQMRVRVIDSVTLEEANSRPWNWTRQRSRWLKGAMQTWLVHMRNPLKTLKEMGFMNFLVFQILIGGTPVSLLLSPLFLLMTIIYVLSRAGLTHIDPIFAESVQTTIEHLFPWYSMYMGTLCLVLGNFAMLYFLLAGNIVRGLYGNVKWMLLTPFYWLMMSFAAWYALWQLITRPHYWEKTRHGLDTKESPEQGVTLLDQFASPFIVPEEEVL